jgi:hypothetical protein
MKKNMRIITTILRIAISIAVVILGMMFRICLAAVAAGSGGSGGSGSASTNSQSGTSTKCFPNEMKISDVWYRNIREVCTGEVEIRKGMGDPIEYVARKPNPVLHPNHYFIYDTYGNKVGDFWNT